VHAAVDEVLAEQSPESLGSAGEAIRSRSKREMVQAHAEILCVLSGTPDTGVEVS
jgi:hypothetical protein